MPTSFPQATLVNFVGCGRLRVLGSRGRVGWANSVAEQVANKLSGTWIEWAGILSSTGPMTPSLPTSRVPLGPPLERPHMSHQELTIMSGS